MWEAKISIFSMLIRVDHTGAYHSARSDRPIDSNPNCSTMMVSYPVRDAERAPSYSQVSAEPNVGLRVRPSHSHESPEPRVGPGRPRDSLPSGWRKLMDHPGRF